MQLVISSLIALLAFPIAYITCALTKHAGVVDAPDGKRKQQAAPIPRLGGVGIAVAIGLVTGGLALAHSILPELMIGGDWFPGPVALVVIALAASLLLFGIGVWDDVFGMSAQVKLVLVTMVCLAAPLLGVSAGALETPFGDVTAPAVMIAGSALWLIVFTNAANFMDGSNGLSLGSMAIMLAGLGAAHMTAADVQFPIGLMAIIAALMGFLVHNMRGTLYAGDCGAFGVGGLFATLALVSNLPVWTIATLALPFLIDVLMTLVLRGRNGNAWFEAHTDHAYQVLRHTGSSHWDVALIWWGLSVTCAIGAVIAVSGGGALPFIVFWVMAVSLSFCWIVVQRQARNQLTRERNG